MSKKSKSSKASKSINESINAEQIVEAFLSDPALFAEVLSGLKAAMAISEQARPASNWLDQFKSRHTTVTVKTNTVTVAVERGHASEWKAQLRAAGFRWSFKNRVYWAWLDDEKRAEVAQRNAENDALTEGMTPEEKRAFWAARKAARKSA